MKTLTLYEQLKEKLYNVVPDAELYLKAQIAEEVLQWKTKRNALILGHNYMEPALFYSVPDYTGDSLKLAKLAMETDKPIIVFCGVRFMAETAKILNPEKMVLLPSLKAGCSLAESISAEEVRKLKAQYPGVPVVCYINTYAEVKAESDVCCTSSNAAAVVEALKSDTVIFIPDEYLAKNVAKETGRHVIVPTKHPERLKDTEVEYVLIGWHGKCEVHEKFTVEDIEAVRKQFSDVVVLAHPECHPDVVAAADFSGSTAAMMRYVSESNAKRYLLLTECSMADNVAAANPDKEMVRLCSVRCPHMNQITLEDTRNALKYLQYEIQIDKAILEKAAQSLKRMFALTG